MFTKPNEEHSSPSQEQTSIRKFLFEQSFDHLIDQGSNRDPSKRPVTLKPEQVEQIKRQAYDEGFIAGTKSGSVAALEREEALLKKIIAECAQLLEQSTARLKEQDEAFRLLLISIARKILPEFIAREASSEIEAMVKATLAEMVHEPRLVIRVHESSFDALNKKLEDMVTQKAYTGKIVLLAEASMNPGDCRIEWADGGIERKPATMLETVASLVNQEPDNSVP